MMYLLPYLLKVSVTLALLTLGYRWLVRRETFSGLNRSLLWINVLAAWLLPWVPLAHWGPAQVQQQVQQQVQRVALWPVLESTLIAENTLATSQVPLSQFQPVPESTSALAWVGTWGWAEWLLALYLLGAGTLLLRLLVGTCRLVSRLRKCPAERTVDGLLLVCDKQTAAPYSFFRWVVYNPEAHSPQELAEILTHEAEHARQWHSLDLLLAEVLRAALWFNPVAWWHQRLVEENLEYLADRAVLGQGFEKKHYQHHLLKMALQAQEVPFTHSFAQTTLKKRIRMMNRRPSSWRAAGRYALLLGVLYGSSALVAPYRARIVQFAPPVVRPIVEAALPTVEPEEERVSQEVPLEEPEQVVSKPTTDTIRPVSMVPLEVVNPAPPFRYAYESNDTLYWAITALCTMDDITRIATALERYGQKVEIIELSYERPEKYDFMFRSDIETYLDHLVVKIGNGWSFGPKSEIPSPTHHQYGFYTLGKKGGRSGGEVPSEWISKVLKEDKQEAERRFAKNRPAHVYKAFEQKMKPQQVTATNYQTRTLYYHTDYARDSILFQKYWILAPHRRFDDIYIDGVPSGYNTVASLPHKDIHSITLFDRGNIVKSVLVLTKQGNWPHGN
ncbi:hypothetical protein GCM10027275_34640 [Rhabdobacter roseus]|uniref:Peptidase M56 domain-containing protein n=1 Tax=Rhabdobacter roseus TaxID=1655419 RepID=A0A840TPP1_9BACT|nr:M56 family metallopeptidase [Rhabdobacter roseus]MBB5285314.1 hypothetical protein [Rhabdobacter roseus]